MSTIQYSFCVFFCVMKHAKREFEFSLYFILFLFIFGLLTADIMATMFTFIRIAFLYRWFIANISEFIAEEVQYKLI